MTPPSKATSAASVHAARLRRVAATTKKLGCDASLITNPKDVGYLTGFLGGDSYLLIPAGRGKPTILSDFRYVEE
ncbi:MAG: aminopeptidase P family N-terminal domain-containing protein, partial [Planctomycetota bacterium]